MNHSITTASATTCLALLAAPQSYANSSHYVHLGTDGTATAEVQNAGVWAADFIYVNQELPNDNRIEQGILHLEWGFTESITFGAHLPHSHVRIAGDTENGFGDVELEGKWQFHNDENSTIGCAG